MDSVACEHCEKEVTPIKAPVNRLLLAILLLLGIVPGVVYLGWNRVQSAFICPDCGIHLYGIVLPHERS